MWSKGDSYYGLEHTVMLCFLGKLNICLLYDPVMLFLGIYSREIKTWSFKVLHKVFVAALLIICLNQKQSNGPPVGEWINKW